MWLTSLHHFAAKNIYNTTIKLFIYYLVHNYKIILRICSEFLDLEGFIGIFSKIFCYFALWVDKYCKTCVKSLCFPFWLHGITQVGLLRRLVRESKPGFINWKPFSPSTCKQAGKLMWAYIKTHLFHFKNVSCDESWVTFSSIRPCFILLVYQENIHHRSWITGIILNANRNKTLLTIL